MNKTNTEYEILNNAIEALRNEMPLAIKEMNLLNGINDRHDAVIDFELYGHALKLYLEVKANINNANLGQVANQIKALTVPALLVTRYINPLLGKKLKELEIPFLDTAGNMYINFPPMYAFVIGNKLNQPQLIDDRNEAWGQAKLRVIFALLCHDKLVNKNYREIARIANTALGTINRTFRDLALKGFAIEIRSKGRKLVDKRTLLDKWVGLYAERLRPKTLIARFETKEAIAEQQIDITGYDAQWGGEIAANKITHYLRPETTLIYTNKLSLNELIFKLKLTKNPEGNVEIRRRFWGNDPVWGGDDTVHPILIYADLLATAEPRNIETARILYDKIILRHIGADR